KRGVIAFEHGYHGLGYGALETTWRNDFRAPFASQLGHFTYFAPYPRQASPENLSNGSINASQNVSLTHVEQRLREILRRGDVGAILVEPFQGRGGEVVPPAGFLSMLRSICDQHRILLIVDEIYTGFWRTGRWFA